MFSRSHFMLQLIPDDNFLVLWSFGFGSLSQCCKRLMFPWNFTVLFSEPWITDTMGYCVGALMQFFFLAVLSGTLRLVNSAHSSLATLGMSCPYHCHPVWGPSHPVPVMPRLSCGTSEMACVARPSLDMSLTSMLSLWVKHACSPYFTTLSLHTLPLILGYRSNSVLPNVLAFCWWTISSGNFLEVGTHGVVLFFLSFWCNFISSHYYFVLLIEPKQKFYWHFNCVICPQLSYRKAYCHLLIWRY